MAWNWFSFIIGIIVIPVLVALAFLFLVMYLKIKNNIEVKRREERTQKKEIEQANEEAKYINPVKDIPIITRDELKKSIDENKNYVLIDVRNEDELKYGMIPTAKNISMPELQTAFELDDEEFKIKYNFEKPKKTDDLIFYCRSGNRSREITRAMVSKGFNARNYKGSTLEWAEIDDNVKKY